MSYALIILSILGLIGIFAVTICTAYCPIPARRRDDCLAGITAQELKDAAQQLDAGNEGPADALVARGGARHGECVAFTILGLTTDADDTH